MTPRPLLSLLVLLAAAPASAAGPFVTVYSRDLGFVRESRVLDARTGRDTIRLEGVSNRLDFSSVRLAPATGRVTRLAYRWDTASGDAVVEKAIGQRVRVVSRGDRLSEGLLVSADGGWLVLRGDDGSVSTLARAAVEEVRLAKAEALSLRPAIEAVLEGAKGATNAELAYLTGGLSWNCEHLLVRTGETSGTWSARVLVENTTGRTFEDARLKLVAGEPSRAAAPPVAFDKMAMRTMAMSAEARGGEALTEAAFADYHLYTLPGAATLRDRESQSLVMIEPRPVQIAPRYVYRGGDARGVAVQLEIVNSAKAGPGAPLAAGRVRVFQADDEKDLQFTGETVVKHTALDEKVTLETGYAFDLAAERKTLADRRVSDREREFSVEVRLRNRKPGAVRIVVEESLGGDVTVTAQSAPSARKDANTLQWTLDVAPGKETVLTYTARQRW